MPTVREDSEISMRVAGVVEASNLIAAAKHWMVKVWLGLPLR
jgi:hypothetical protein